MFKRITLKNFRTHTDSVLDLSDVTLLIGSNNAGKSNLFSGINHFSKIVARGRPGLPTTDLSVLVDNDLFPHRHRLTPRDAPMSFSCEWMHKLGRVEYEIELYEATGNRVGCRETITLFGADNKPLLDHKVGHCKLVHELRMQKELAESKKLDDVTSRLVGRFFPDLGTCFLYHLQSSFLQGKVAYAQHQVDPTDISIAPQLGFEGGNLFNLLAALKVGEQRTYRNVVNALQRFEGSFRDVGVHAKRQEPVVYFDLGGDPPRIDDFPTDVVSDGILRALAIAVLTSMQRPPALILIEEIEDGISQRNLGRFLGWLRQAVGLPDSSDRGYATQFVLTSHSPSVLREFASHLGDVHHVFLSKRGHKSVVRNLGQALMTYIDLGTLSGDYVERDGKVVSLEPHILVEAWYKGTLGGESDR